MALLILHQVYSYADQHSSYWFVWLVAIMLESLAIGHFLHCRKLIIGQCWVSLTPEEHHVQM